MEIENKVEEQSEEPIVVQKHGSDFKLGQVLSSPDPGEGVVISGMAGVFPNSDNIQHFGHNLYHKADMLSDIDRRWKINHPELPKRSGMISDLDKYDAGFFGTHFRQSHTMDPMCRIFMEKAVECIMDAGLSPREMEGSKTAVIVGTCFSESHKYWLLTKSTTQNYSYTGVEHSMIPNRLSYYLKLNGPSYTVDTACSSSLYALEQAYRAMRSGECDNVIVGGCNLCLYPFYTLLFARLGVLSMDGTCKVFDTNGNGYARSEAIVAVLLQKAKSARRIYSHILHAKVGCDGYKEQGITFPSSEAQRQLMEDVYNECDVDPTSLSFLEAHGTGTKVGDPEEVLAIDPVFCKNRDRPLLVGSVKSNIGHTEPSSGLCSIVKVILGMESGLIPPNMYFRKAREGCEALEEGRLKVVVDDIPFEDDRGLIGVNSFGFGGGNCHVLLHWNQKLKVNKALPTDELPRLVFASGRTQEAVQCILDDIQNRDLDAEYVWLYHQVFRKHIPDHHHRGYIIRSKSGEISRSNNFCGGNQRPVFFLFTELGSSWTTVFDQLYVLPLFAVSIQRIHNILVKNNTNLLQILNSKKEGPVFDRILGNISVQIAIVDVLKTLEIRPNSCFGVGFGEFVCAYLDGCLTLEEAVLSVLHIALQCQNCPSMDNLKAHLSKQRPLLVESLDLILGKNSDRNEQLLPFRAEAISAEYFVNGLCTSLDFYDYIPLLPRNCVVLEFGCSLAGIPQNGRQFLSFPDKGTNSFVALLDILGRLYQSGHIAQIGRLYPKIQTPVGRGTPMISPLIKWDHNAQWTVPTHSENSVAPTVLHNCRGKSIVFSPKEEDWTFLIGHIIDGRNIVPATFYIYFVWEVLSEVEKKFLDECKIVFQDCQFVRATPVSTERLLEIELLIQKGNGNFEVRESNEVVMTGRVFRVDNITEEQTNFMGLPSSESGDDKENLVLQTKDIYKEMRLRGYNYKGMFRMIKEYDKEGCKGLINWNGNWITFLDNLLQMKILQIDSRLLYVPTYIKKLSIDPKKHLAYVKSFGENPCLPAYVYEENNVIKCGAVEIRGPMATSIFKRKPRGDPVLEKYEFIPNYTKLSTAESIRVNIQLILENLPNINVKVVELIPETAPEYVDPLAPIVFEVLGDLPLVRPQITILTKRQLEVTNVAVEDAKLSDQTDCILVIGFNMLRDTVAMIQAFSAVKDKGFILSRETLDFQPKQTSDIDVLTIHETESEKLILIRKNFVSTKPPTVIDISKITPEFEWFPQLQKSLVDNEDILVLAQGDPSSGLIGLVNCLRREPSGSKLKGIFLADSAPQFDLSSPFYAHLNKNLAINVFKNGTWGTYRHLLLDDIIEVEREHCFVNVLTKGDLSSLRWIEGHLTRRSKPPPEEEIVHVYYTALNFRDIMTATGRINADVITRDRTQQECVQGFEFSGRTHTGKRVMGMTTACALATMISVKSIFLWPIPENWTLEDAATVPVVYGTVLYAFFIVTTLRRGQTVLIHAGSGGVGQAAITVALHIGCTVYTTVGTQEKRDFLKKRFPQLRDHQIGNSRDISFEKMIHEQTKGRGVDVVLNSLAEEKLQASIKCLARGGVFLEIGKYDMVKNNSLRLLMLEKEASFHGVMLDSLFTEDPCIQKQMIDVMNESLSTGAIKPLVRTAFKSDELEDAFRYMAGGKHIGKVLIQIRKEEAERDLVPAVKLFKGIPRYSCNPENVYIVIGGLGGFGLELADWLVLRGARKLVLTSRTGLKTGYQKYRIDTWREYGTVVHISTADVTSEVGCEEMIRESFSFGKIDAIFNLAVVLKDALIENQSSENFRESFGPKAFATKHLDQVSRRLCPDLRDFVVFSSVSCGRGNAGQSNYGMANSVMERICERRKSDGLPAVAIQWGAVGDVGLVAQMQEDDVQMEIGGTLQQKITNCLEVLDTLLRQDSSAIVGSMVVAEKRRGAGGANNIVDAVANILGIRDTKTVSQHATLAELGMDSISGVEIKQTLEREFDVFLTPQDMRSMTFARLQEIQEEKQQDGGSKTKTVRPLHGFEMMVRQIQEENVANIPILTQKSYIEDTNEGPQFFVFPGIEGVAKNMEPLALNLRGPVRCVQYAYDRPDDSVSQIAKKCFASLEPEISKNRSFCIVAHSYGAIIALEVMSMLEEKGLIGTLICLDGAPYMLRTLLKTQLDVGSEAYFQTGFLCQALSLHLPFEVIMKHKDNLLSFKTFEDRLKHCEEVIPNDSRFTPEFWKQSARVVYNRLKALNYYEPKYKKLESVVKLIKPEAESIANLAEDYKLSDLCQDKVEVTVVAGNHATILNNEVTAKIVNRSMGIEIEEEPESEEPEEDSRKSEEDNGQETTSDDQSEVEENPEYVNEPKFTEPRSHQLILL